MKKLVSEKSLRSLIKELLLLEISSTLSTTFSARYGRKKSEILENNDWFKTHKNNLKPIGKSPIGFSNGVLCLKVNGQWWVGNKQESGDLLIKHSVPNHKKVIKPYNYKVYTRLNGNDFFAKPSSKEDVLSLYSLTMDVSNSLESLKEDKEKLTINNNTTGRKPIEIVNEISEGLKQILADCDKLYREKYADAEDSDVSDKNKSSTGKFAPGEGIHFNIKRSPFIFSKKDKTIYLKYYEDNAFKRVKIPNTYATLAKIFILPSTIESISKVEGLAGKIKKNKTKLTTSFKQAWEDAKQIGE